MSNQLDHLPDAKRRELALVVVHHDDLTDVPKFWQATEDAELAASSDGTALRTPVSLIYHSLDDVNEKLRPGRYFFIDILRDGVVLFEEPDRAFVEPRPLSAADALAKTQGFFDDRFESAAGFLDTARYAFSKDRLKEAAFQLHQATERFFQCLFLVRALYTPKPTT